jgi:hypothetical protein
MRYNINFNRLIFGVCLFFLYTNLSSSQEYVLLGWNDLGMHCSNKDFAKIAVLPPYNNITAQLIVRRPNQLPQVVTSGYTIEYSIPNNTYSVGKTNFWTYAQQLFGLSSPLPSNIGLTGKGLTGILDSSGNYFSAHGIPITPFPDSDLVNESPFQLIHLVARSKMDGSVLATTDVVIPVSNEVGCVQSGCHSSETSILNSHESVSGFNRSGPVLCASCHASNALGTTGTQEAMPFSYRIHEKHSSVAGPSGSIATCYKCHPGPKTQCLRDVMGKNPTNPLVCQDCHGTMSNVASTIAAGRRPWLDEPKCGNCHGSVYAEETGKLYRQSKGHGGLFCSACHGSPHAIQPTVQPNDNIQNTRLQGFAGTLQKCSVCHSSHMDGLGPHGIADTTTVSLSMPLLSYPSNYSNGITTNPQMQWNVVQTAQTYALQISLDSLFSTTVVNDSGIAQTYWQVNSLNPGVHYFWRVRAKNQSISSSWSQSWEFITATGTTFSINLDNRWNLVSLPLEVTNPIMNNLFPTASTKAFEYGGSIGYLQKDTLEPGKGYWIKFSAPQPVSLTGVPVISDSIHVTTGWNLIGSISSSLPTFSIFSNPPGMVTSYFYGYDHVYVKSDTIYPGKAYWVKLNQPGYLFMSQAVSKNAYGKIQIMASSELPPPPPGGEGIIVKEIPKDFQLEQSFPNPFNPSARIGYSLPVDSKVTLKIYDILGREVATLVQEEQSRGYRSVEWNATGVTSGIYFYKLEAVSTINSDMVFSDIKKMVVMK